jgi:hypothetical protein
LCCAAGVQLFPSFLDPTSPECSQQPIAHDFAALQVFIFSFVSGTALSQLQALLDDPHRIVSLLGSSAVPGDAC